MARTKFKDSAFYKTISRADEADIEKLDGFRTPDEEEREQVEKTLKKSAKKDMTGALFWAVLGTAFCVLHIAMYIKLRENASLLFLAIFAATAIFGGYRFWKLHTAMAKVNRGEYQIHEVKIAKEIPGVLSQSGRRAVKVAGTDGNIYSREFNLTRKDKKAWKKDPDALFWVVKISDESRYALVRIGEISREPAENSPKT